MKIHYYAIVLLMMPATPASASFYTGNDLYKLCTVERSQSTYYQESAHCAGFIVGVVDTNELLRSIWKAQPCVPPTVNIRQVHDAVVAYLKAHPAKRHLDAALLVNNAVVEAFECKAPS